MDYPRRKRTKIVATLGPASDDEQTLRQMFEAGLDVVRINFSHSSPDYLEPVIERVKKLRRETGRPVAILGDLRGPRIRVGEMAGGSILLEAGQQIRLTSKPVIGQPNRISVSYDHLADDVQPNGIILLDDGNITLQVETVKKNGDVLCRVRLGGHLSSRRGINLPGQRVSLPSVTQKDYADIDFAIRHDFDFLALSFVQSAADVRHLNQYLAEKGSDIPVIAKIERRNALEDLDTILQEAYGVMVARGDLALEMSLEEIPIAQKRIIAAGREAAAPVITATQMLESMIEMCKPTRAEATDVANAILDGTDAVMLSAETAIGKHPVETISVMAAIAASTENAWRQNELPAPPDLTPPQEIEPMVAYAGHMVAQSLKATAIVAYTASGATARRVVCHRPSQRVLALSANIKTCQRLSLSWGVESALTNLITTTDHMAHTGLKFAQQCGLARPGDTVVITAGTPPHGASGRTNTLKIEKIPETEAERD